MQTVYEAAGGDEGLRRLASAWHARVMSDEVVSHAFSHGFHPEHSQRLAAYWAEALGDPTTYSDNYGDETTVVRIHSGNGRHAEMDRGPGTAYRAEPLREAQDQSVAHRPVYQMAASVERYDTCGRRSGRK